MLRRAITHDADVQSRLCNLQPLLGQLQGPEIESANPNADEENTRG